MRRLLKNIFILINVPIAICLLFSYLAIYFNPASFLPPAFFGLAYPYILLINILFVLLWLIFNAKYSLISIVCILAGITFVGKYVQLSGEKTDHEGIKICSYNLKYYMGEGVSPKLKTVDSIAGMLERGQYDIICLQEASVASNSKSMRAIKNRLNSINNLKKTYTSHTARPVIYSQFPIIKNGEIEFKNSGNMVIYADLKIKKDTVRVYNCHLESYRIQPKEINSLDSISFSDNPKDFEDVKHIGSKLKRAFITRAKQADTLREHIDNSPYPVIVCGDFNDTPVSYAYHMVKGNLLDAFVESGVGIGNTYNGHLPSFRIDYILYDSMFKSYNFATGKEQFSDHFPIHCQLNLEYRLK